MAKRREVSDMANRAVETVTSRSRRHNFELASRLDDVPIIHYIVQQVSSLYDHTKRSNRLFNFTLNTTESAVKGVANRTQPVVDFFWPLISFVDSIACGTLEKVEYIFPIIKTHPEEVRDYGRRRYDQSYLKKGVDTVYAAKDFSVDKINATRQMCWDLMASLTTQEGQKADLRKLMQLSQRIVDSTIEYTDSLMDKYIPAEDIERFKARKEEAKGYVERLRCLTSKFASGVNKQAVDGYHSAKDGTVMAFHQLAASMRVMDLLRGAQSFINEKSSASFATARNQTHKALGLVDQTTVWMLHLMAMNTQMVSDQLLGCCVRFLPRHASYAAQSAMTYVDDICKTVTQAKSTGEVKDELISEAGEKIELCRRRFLDALGTAADYAPVSWVQPNNAG